MHGLIRQPCMPRFEPERFLEPRNEGADELWNGYQVRACICQHQQHAARRLHEVGTRMPSRLQVVFGAGDPATQHACAGKNIAITVLLALLIRLVQVILLSC